jgi:hypothetical protein
MKTLHIWPDQVHTEKGWITSGFNIEEPAVSPLHIWYRLPASSSDAITESCDPFVISTIFKAMRISADIHVHGAVSPSLLKNLEEFQSVWVSWKPEVYRRIEVRADVECEQETAKHSVSLMTFSGGVDSCFTAWRHRRGWAGRQTTNLQAGLMIHGFDIPLKQAETFVRATASSKAILDSVGMELIPLIHNSKYLHQDLDDSHGAILASCMMLLQKRFSIGLIASSVSYTDLLDGCQLPYGSSTLTDWMLSNQSFSIIEDGAGYTRIDKVGEISVWPEAMQYLRVCLGREASMRDHNCCRCEKCVRNILTFRALGLERPACFEKNISIAQVLGLHYSNNMRSSYIRLLRRAVKQKQLPVAWIIAMKINLLANHYYSFFKHSNAKRS